MLIQMRTMAWANKWLLLALILLVLFAIYTVLVVSGVLLYSTLSTEQWLLHRPLTGVDCVLRPWGQVGNPGPTMVIVLLLGVVCLLLRYRPRVLFYLCCFFLLGLGAEYVGKQYIAQALPGKLALGLDMLACPQLSHTSHSTRLMLYLGMWWKAPVITEWDRNTAFYSATTPFSLADADTHYGYPSGHAIRWCFIGLIACWLAWRHIRPLAPRILCIALTLVVALGGGLDYVYIGYHLTTDTVGGYLLGACLACCAIAFLIKNEHTKRNVLVQGASLPFLGNVEKTTVAQTE